MIENSTVIEKEVSCRVINSVLKYLESQGYEATTVLEGLPFTEEYLKDPFNWVPSSVREAIGQRAADLVKDDAVMYQVGLLSPRLKSISGVEQMVLLLGGPGIAFRNIQKYSSLFDKLVRYEVSVDGDKAVVSMSWPSGCPVSKSSCYYTQGMLAAIPTLWGLPPGEIHEKKCMFQPGKGGHIHGIEYGAERCVYEVTWQSLPPWYAKIGRKVFNPGFFRERSIKELEENFRLLDRKNAELRLRNSQLAKVREIALAITKVRTPAQVYESVVELARDIPGIRFVLILRADKSNGDVFAPYYSRIRNQNLARALKMVGFDLGSVFGEKPDSQKFKFSRTSSKVAQQYQSNPKLVVVKSLAELLDGLWPKAVCDAIQKVAKIESTVLVPVSTEDGYESSILFILHDEVSQDILEMVGAHCSTALKNVAVLQALEQRNRELAAINEITKQTSSSLELAEVLSNTIREAVAIFDGQAGSIYLLDEKKQKLRLTAQSGMPQLMAKQFESLPLDASVLGKFFTSSKDIFTGDLNDYKREYPESASAFKDANSANFASMRLFSKEGPTGMLTIIRKNNEGFDVKELTLFQAITNQVSLAIENASLHSNALKRVEESERARKELEAAVTRLTESERKYRLITDNTVDYIAMMDLKGIYTYISPSHTRLGYEVTDLLGKSGLNFMHPDDRKRLVPLFTKYMGMKFKELLGLKQGHVSETISFRVPDKQGSWHNFEAIANLTDALDGTGLNMLLISRDVTEHLEAERAMRESEEKYRTVFESANDIIMILDRKGTIVDINAKLKEIGGWEREELIGKNIRSLIKIISKKSLPIILANFLKRMTGFNVSPYQVELLKSNGEPADIEINATAIRKNGKVVGDLAILRDVTERRKAQAALAESEAYMKDMFESAVVGILVIDAESHIITDANSMAVSMIGDSKARIIGSTCHQYICPAECGKCPITDLGQKIDNSERILLRVDGQQTAILKSVAYISRNGRKLLLETIFDISERKRAEVKLKANRDLIERILSSEPNAVLAINKDHQIILANQAFYRMSNQVESVIEGRKVEDIVPLNGLSEIISAALGGKLPEQQIEFKCQQDSHEKFIVANVINMDKEGILLILNDVTEERERQSKFYLTDRLASVGEMASGIAHELNNPLTSITMLSQMLVKEDMPPEDKEDLQTIQAEAKRAAAIVKNLLTFARKHAPERQSAQLNRVLEDVLKLRSYEHKVNNIQVDVRLDEDLPEVKVDYFQMQQVFLNLVLNAEQAMIESHHQGRLTVTTERVNGHIKASIGDDGSGISEENQKKLFTPFFTTKEVGKGTGLGLSISYGIVTNHGGRIYAESEPGEGATFVVELPVNGN
jgi:two-component system, NtrC family, sensor kinase